MGIFSEYESHTIVVMGWRIRTRLFPKREKGDCGVRLAYQGIPGR